MEKEKVLEMVKEIKVIANGSDYNVDLNRIGSIVKDIEIYLENPKEWNRFDLVNNLLEMLPPHYSAWYVKEDDEYVFDYDIWVPMEHEEINLMYAKGYPAEEIIALPKDELKLKLDCIVASLKSNAVARCIKEYEDKIEFCKRHANSCD